MGVGNFQHGWIWPTAGPSTQISAMEWTQVYDPLSSPWLSTVVAALPIVLLLGSLGLLGWSAPKAAALGLASALAVAILEYGMPWQMAIASAAYGAAFGLFPIGWIVLAAIFLY